MELRHLRPRVLVTLGLVAITLLSGCNDSLLPPPPRTPPRPPTQSATWDLVGLQGETKLISVAVVRARPWEILVGTMNTYSSETPGKILRSQDWGKTWTVVLDSVSVSQIVVEQNEGNRVYATLNMGNHPTPVIARSLDAGRTWEWVDFGIDLDGLARVGPLRIDPVHTNVVYAGTIGRYGGGFYKSTDMGTSWRLTPPDRPGENSVLRGGVSAIAIDPKNPNELYVAEMSPGSVYKSYDGGATFQVLDIPVLDVPDGIEVDPYHSNIVYLGMRSGGLFRSSDHGASWGSSLAANAWASKIVSRSDSLLFASSGWNAEGGMFGSTDAGVTWSLLSPGPRFVHDIAIDTTNNFVYSLEVQGAESGLYRYKIR